MGLDIEDDPDCGIIFSSASSASSGSSSSGAPAENPNYIGPQVPEDAKAALNPKRVQAIIFNILIDHFSCPENIHNPNLTDKVWTKDPTTTKIWITTVSRWKPKETAIRPALIVKRKSWEQQRVSIQDRHHGESVINTGGGSTFTRETGGQHQILCVGRNGVEAEDLAFEVEELFTCFSPIIRSEFLFKEFECSGLGELSPLEEDKTNFVLPVGLTYRFYWTWLLSKVAPKWKTTEVRTRP